MLRDVLSEKSYNKAQKVISVEQEEDDSSDNQNREYDYGDPCNSEPEESSNDSYEDSDGSEGLNSRNEEDRRAIFEQWQLYKLMEILGIFCTSIDQFTKKSIDTYAIETFLKHHVTHGYSWLINEEIEYVTRSFSAHIEEQVGMPKDMLCEILESLWFQYDWEQFSIKDKLFIAQTYKKALLNLKEGCYGSCIKEHLVRSLTELFTFQPADFAKTFEPFSRMRKNFNAFVQQHNWLGALIEWSVYCIYRKVFAEHEKTTLKQSDSLLMPQIQAFNAKKHVLTSLKKAHKRAQDTYSKVYVHKTTTKLAFVDSEGKKGELELSENLKKLRSRGQSYEPYRPRRQGKRVCPSGTFYCPKT